MVGAPIGAADDETFVEIDVTAFVTGNGSWSFAITDASSADYVDFYSRETTSPPQLVITTS